MRKLFKLFLILTLIFFGIFHVSQPTQATPIDIDGFGTSTGIHDGFANVIGNQSTLEVRSNNTGDLHFIFTKGPGDWNDIAVMYIDSDNGNTGVDNTSSLTDTTDPHRMAISGSNAVNSAHLGFAPGFLADYAIAIDATYAGLWEIASDTSNFAHQKEVGIGYPKDVSDATFEFNLTMSDLGLQPRDTFRYVITYINPQSATPSRSNEFHGVAETTVSGLSNPQGATVNLAPGDYITFSGGYDVLPEITISDPVNNSIIGTNEINLFYSIENASTLDIFVDNVVNSTEIPTGYQF